MIEVEKKYIRQTTPKDCFVYAAMNAAIYLGKKDLPNFEDVARLANKENYTDEDSVIEFLNLPMRKYHHRVVNGCDHKEQKTFRFRRVSKTHQTQTEKLQYCPELLFEYLILFRL